MMLLFNSLLSIKISALAERKKGYKKKKKRHAQRLEDHPHYYFSHLFQNIVLKSIL